MFQNVNSFFQLNLSSFAGVDGWHSCRQCAACWQVGNPHAGSFINAALCKIIFWKNVIFKFSQDGEGEVGVAQGSDDCLQCSQVCYKLSETGSLVNIVMYLIHREDKAKSATDRKNMNKLTVWLSLELRGFRAFCDGLENLKPQLVCIALLLNFHEINRHTNQTM